MTPINMMIGIAVFAWLVQIALTFFQIKAFNNVLQSLAIKGKVRIGRTAKRWKKRTILVLVEDEQGLVIDARMLRGFSVFARPIVAENLINHKYPFDDVAELDDGLKEAIESAFS